jgi:hypothetical protein
MFKILVVSILLFAASLFAQPDTLAKEKPDPFFKNALQFQITDNFRLTSFNGNLSYKRHFSRQSAIRLGLDFGAFTSNRDEIIFFTPIDSTID